MDLELEGKVVLVLAASKGLGRAAALQFAEEGAHVMISSRNEDDLARTQQEIIKQTNNENIAYAACDITKPEDITRLVDAAVSKFGPIDVLVNNAGGPPAGGFESFTDEQWEQAFQLNLLSFIRAIRAVLPSMKEKQRGHIINFASSSIKQSIDNLILSNTFRAGIVGLSKSLSQELASDNILINTIGPGRIATDRVDELDGIKAEKANTSVENIKKQAESSIPLGRYGEPEEFAKQAVFLCSGANTYVTGQSFVVDGGMVKAL
ncbi:SDR family oxidoreductase [Alteribacillus sp. HJP-4]|uniref:SDR family oxidoreductase n=1 Tax=Alteribacillus sp. HJP-4 TaxID=2775394 RepID=UPI0035CD106F